MSKKKPQQPTKNQRANAANAAAVEKIISGTVETPAARRMKAVTYSRPARGSSEVNVPYVRP